MFKRWVTLVVILLTVGMVLSCLSPKESFIKRGASLLTQKEIADAFRGNTVQSLDWSAYYREDGARIVNVRGRKAKVLKWYVDPRGSFCQESLTGRTDCNMKVYRLGGQYKVFANNSVYTFKVIPGKL